MPLSISKLRGKTVETKINVADENEPEATLSVTYRTGIYTPNFMAKLQDASQNDPRIAGELTAKLVKSWDLIHGQDEDTPEELRGKTIALNAESLNEYLPFELLARIIGAIARDASPNPKSPVNSGNSSLQAEEEGPVLANIG